MIRATLDTNVLVSGFAGLDAPHGTPGSIFLHWLNGTFELVVSRSILAEFERAMRKPYFASRRTPEQAATATRLIANRATIVVPTVDIAGVAPHPADDLVLSAAVSAGVGCLVTGDKRFRGLGTYRGARLVTPREFLDRLQASSEEVR